MTVEILHAPRCYICDTFTGKPRASVMHKGERARFCSDKCLKVFKDAVLGSVIFGGRIILIKEKSPTSQPKNHSPEAMKSLTPRPEPKAAPTETMEQLSI
jgi:hypothetical protein